MYLKCMHKFGIECLKTVEDSFELDKLNYNTMWVDAIAKEMRMSKWHFIPLRMAYNHPMDTSSLSAT